MADAGGGPPRSGAGDPPALRVSLRASVIHVDSRALEIHFSVQNGEASPLYVLDRLWMLDRGSRVVSDPQRVYRYVRDKTLRLLLGNAPLPRRKSVLYRNVPNATLVPPGRALERDLEIPVPVSEYSPYFKGEKPSDYADAPVTSVELFVDYIPSGPDIATAPASYDSAALTFDTPGVWAHARRLRSGLLSVSTLARRRTDPFDRLFLPDENPDRP